MVAHSGGCTSFGSESTGDDEQDRDRGCSISSRRHAGAWDLVDLMAGIYDGGRRCDCGWFDDGKPGSQRIGSSSGISEYRVNSAGHLLQGCGGSGRRNAKHRVLGGSAGSADNDRGGSRFAGATVAGAAVCGKRLCRFGDRQRRGKCARSDRKSDDNGRENVPELAPDADADESRRCRQPAVCFGHGGQSGVGANDAGHGECHAVSSQWNTAVVQQLE